MISRNRDSSHTLFKKLNLHVEKWPRLRDGMKNFSCACQCDTNRFQLEVNG